MLDGDSDQKLFNIHLNQGSTFTMFCLLATHNVISKPIIAIVSIIILASLSKGVEVTISVILGCGVALLPSVLFQKMCCAKNTSIEAKQLLKRFYMAAALKFLFLIVLFFFLLVVFSSIFHFFLLSF